MLEVANPYRPTCDTQTGRRAVCSCDQWQFDKRKDKCDSTTMETKYEDSAEVAGLAGSWPNRMIVGSVNPVEIAVKKPLPDGAKGLFPLRIGSIKADIVGGPYNSKPPQFYGIKMAEEISRDCVISIPTRDFNVPDRGRLLAGLYAGISLAQQGCPLWVGCMGGIGRTGLYLAALAKVMAGYQRLTKKRPIDPIQYVRATYYAHAVETDQQVRWVYDLDVYDVVQWVAVLQGYRSPWYRRLFR